MYERMLNKNEKPTAEQMASYCGATSTMFTELNEWISNGDSTVQAIVFPYGNNYGWGISHKGKGKLICNVFPESGAFTVMIRLSDKQFSSVYEKLDEYAKEYIDNNCHQNRGNPKPQSRIIRHRQPTQICNGAGFLHSIVYRTACHRRISERMCQVGKS